MSSLARCGPRNKAEAMFLQKCGVWHGKLAREAGGRGTFMRFVEKALSLRGRHLFPMEFDDWMRTCDSPFNAGSKLT